MFPAVGEHGRWRLERRPPGFEFTPGLLGKITTYVAVAPDGELVVFAFMYSFRQTGGPLADESALAESALEVVRAALDADGAAGSEHLYELAPNGWRPAVRPAWWISLA